MGIPLNLVGAVQQVGDVDFARAFAQVLAVEDAARPEQARDVGPLSLRDFAAAPKPSSLASTVSSGEETGNRTAAFEGRRADAVERPPVEGRSRETNTSTFTMVSR